MAKVLIIDDDESIRVFVRHFLEQAGYMVHEAADGKQGVALFAEQKPDLTIVDIFMPEKDGIETLGDLRRDHPQARILAISGGGQLTRLDFLLHAKTFGADEILAKPFTETDLVTTVDRLCALA